MNLSWANQFAKTALRSAQQKIDSVLDIRPEDGESATTSTVVIDEILISPVPEETSEIEQSKPTETFAIQDTGQEPEAWGSAWGGLPTDPELVVDSEPNPIRDDEHHVTPLLDHSPLSSGSDSADNNGSAHSSPHKEASNFKDVDLTEEHDSGDSGDSPITHEPLLPPNVGSARDSLRGYHHDDSLTVASSDIEVIRNVDAWSVSSSKLTADHIPVSSLAPKESNPALQAQLQLAEQRRQELKSANDALQKEKAQLQQRIVVLNQQQTTLKKEVEDKKKECDDLLEEGKKISDYSGKQAREIRRLKNEMSDFEKVKSERKRYKDEKAQAEETIELQKEELSNLKSMIKTLESSSEQLKKEHTQSAASSEVVQKHIDAQEKRIAELEEELSTIRADMTALSETNKALQSEMEHMHSAQWADRIAGERANETAATVVQELDEARQHIERLTAQLTDAQSRLENALHEQGSIAETISQANAPLLEELSDLKIELQNEQQQAEESDKKARAAKKEVEEMKKKLAAAEEKHSNSIMILRQEMDSLLKKNTTQEMELTRLRQQQANEEANFSTVKKNYESKIEQLHTELLSVGEENAKLRKNLKEFKEDNDRLLHDLAEIQKVREIPMMASPAPAVSHSVNDVPADPQDEIHGASVPMSYSFAISGGAAQAELESMSMQYESSLKRIAHLENETKRSQQLESQIRQHQRELKELNHNYNQLLELDGERLEKLEEQAQDILDLRSLLKEQLIAFADAKAREEKEKLPE